MVTQQFKTLPERQGVTSVADAQSSALSSDPRRVDDMYEGEQASLTKLSELEAALTLGEKTVELRAIDSPVVELLIEKPVPPVQDSGKNRRPSIRPGQRRCPEIADSERPLLIQTIDLPTCDTRQRDGYHKCSSCIHMSRSSFLGNGLPPLDNCPSRLADARLADLQRASS